MAVSREEAGQVDFRIPAVLISFGIQFPLLNCPQQAFDKDVVLAALSS
jgi:hypothetical protein